MPSESDLFNCRLIVGLGNPGPRYGDTRHNLGFMVLDQMCGEAGGAAVNWRSHGQGLLAKLSFAGGERLLLKPLTFMNLSGEAVEQVVSYYKIGLDEIVVVHDDIDLAFGALRVRSGAGDGGHNGVKSVTQALGSKEYARLRCGVGRPGVEGQAAAYQGAVTQIAVTQSYNNPSVVDWVLKPFDFAEKGGVQDFLNRAVMALQTLCTQGVKAAQNKFNREE